MRIISLLPSATEIICSLGLREHLVGVTHECDYPVDIVGLPIVTKSAIPHDASSIDIDQLVRSQLETTTALYSLNVELLDELHPDIIITQALCEVCAVSEAEIEASICQLSKRPRVVNLEPMCLKDVFDTLLLVGQETNQRDIAVDVVHALNTRVERVRVLTESHIKKAQYPKVAFLEWIDPPFNAGHWTPELIEMAGGIDCLGNKHQPSQTTLWERIIEVQPDVMFVACCGFPMERAIQDLPILQANEGWEDLPCVKRNRVYFSDGNSYFNRPGPRLVDSLEIIANALHPDVHILSMNLPPAIRVLD
ncbi:MAG: cobalamin-binding protein [Gammaproteobacteria bacterium]|nr:MAG: cobalamin-binding protein [Gammaproteobacteria bacterium]